MADSIFKVSSNIGNPAHSIDTNGAPLLVVNSSAVLTTLPVGTAVSASFAVTHSGA